jgi:hypothetical protein
MVGITPCHADDPALSQPPNCALTRSPTAGVARLRVMKNLAEFNFVGSRITQKQMREAHEGAFPCQPAQSGSDRRDRHREESNRDGDRRQPPAIGTRVRSAVASRPWYRAAPLCRLWIGVE